MTEVVNVAVPSSNANISELSRFSTQVGNELSVLEQTAVPSFVKNCSSSVSIKGTGFKLKLVITVLYAFSVIAKTY